MRLPNRALAALLIALALCAFRASPLRADDPAGPVLLGDDVFLAGAWHELGDRCIGIVTNASGVTSDGRNFVDAVRAHGHICVRALFAPEHGLRGDRPAGSYVPSYTDEHTGLPVYSLYGATRHPSAAMLDGIDVLVFDIQDVGARPYTFASTMAYVMQSAAAAGKEIWVLDRPNPVGGTLVEGPVLDPRFKSFVGLYPIPERPGMTIGELARLFNDRFAIGANLKVIPMRGWRRDMVWDQTGLRWTATSPNIPYAKTALVYLATGLIDEAGLNNGVGSDKPFERAGTLGMDGPAYAAALNARHVPGVHFEPAAWTPHAGFWKGRQLSGVEIDIDDAHAFPSVRTAIELLCAARDLGPYVRIHNALTLDRDWGTDTVRRRVLAGESPDEIVRAAQANVPAFLALRDKYLLY
ncbi:MAG: DUF1343 domain-containing protein [Candidatus Velthaea sp.]|jgi:uncharacterized protein YbbC (DUF1343 family)